MVGDAGRWYVTDAMKGKQESRLLISDARGNVLLVHSNACSRAKSACTCGNDPQMARAYGKTNGRHPAAQHANLLNG